MRTSPNTVMIGGAAAAAAVVIGLGFLFLRQRPRPARETPPPSRSTDPAQAQPARFDNSTASSRRASSQTSAASVLVADGFAASVLAADGRSKAATPRGGAGGLDGALAYTQADAAALDGMVARLADAFGTDDLDAVAGLEADLAAWVGGSEERALALFARFRSSEDADVLALIAAVLAGDPSATASELVAASMLDLVERSETPAQREHALRFLAESLAPLPGLTDQLARIAGSGDPALAGAAVAALVSRANLTDTLRDESLPIAVQLIVGSPDPELRSAFLGEVPLQDAPRAAVDSVIRALGNDASADVRAAAAHALGGAHGASRPRAVEALTEAFRNDASLDTRRTVLASLVRLEGGRAAERIASLRDDAGSATADVDDYLAILQSGETQADRIVRLKFERESARGGSGEEQRHHD